MNCEQFADIVHDLLRNEALDASVIEDAFGHAEACPGCEMHLEEVESLTASLHSLAALDASEQAPASVEKYLLAEFQKKHAATRPTFYKRFLVPAVVFTAAAAVLLISVALFRQHTPAAGSAPQQTIAAAVPKTLNAADSSAADTGESPVSDENAAESFVPLSEAYDVSSLQDATVVRVVLSRAAIESFG
jgi:hypothetical protein